MSKESSIESKNEPDLHSNKQKVSNNENMSAVHAQLNAAVAKYGKTALYNMQYKDLITEFGLEAFPLFMTRFRGEQPSHVGLKTDIPLWAITECFCYADYPESHFSTDNEYLKCVNTTQDQVAYMKLFAQVLRYRAIS